MSNGVLLMTDVGLSAVEKEKSSATGEDGEAERAGTVSVVKSEMAWTSPAVKRGVVQ